MSNARVPPPPGMATYSQPPVMVPGQYPVQPPFGNRKTVKIIVGVVLGLALLVILFVGAILGFVFSLMKSSEPYQHALQAAASDASVRQKLGVPIKEGWWASGSINLSGASGNADISIPVHGSERSGTLYVVAKKSAGLWKYETLELAVEGEGERINLLPPDQQWH